MDDLIWLQDRLFKLSSINISQIKEEILCSSHISTNESVINLAHNIILATQTRCLQLPLYVDLVIFLVSQKEKTDDDPILQLIPELGNFCFKHSNLNKDFQPFLVLNCFKYNQFYFLYLLFREIHKIRKNKKDKNSVFSNFDVHYMIDFFYEQYLKYSQFLPFEIVQLFLPEIEKNDKNLYFSLTKKKSNNQADINSIIQIRDNFFCNSELLQALQDDDVDKLQKVSLSIKLSDEIEMWHFYPFRMTNITFPLNLSAFFGSLKCFKFILLNDPDNSISLINDDLMRDAVLGGNVEIIRIVSQRNESQINDELINYTITAHQNEIAQWIIDNNKDIKLNLFIEACLYSNNIEMLDSILYSIPDSEKLNIFNNNTKNCLALQNCASSGFFEIIRYLFDNEHVNSWKNKQSVFMNILLKIAEKSSVEFVDYLYKNNIAEFNKYIMNYTELLIAAAKSGKNDMFNFALKLFKSQKKRPKSNKKILGNSIIGKNFEIFKKCIKLFPNDLNEMYKDRFSLLSLSIIKNQKDIFDFLLSNNNSKNEIDINQNFRGKTPLFYSLIYRRNEMAIELLNKPNIDINSGFPIMIAIKFGFVDAVKKMCQFEQLNINDAITPDGNPLLLSIEKKDIESFKALLSVKNIDVNISSSLLPTPIMKAIETCQDNSEFQDILFTFENIDLNINSYKYTDLMQVAILSGNAKAIKELDKRNFKLSNLNYPFDINKESLDAICHCKNFSPSFFSMGYLNYFVQQKFFEIAKFCLSFDECDVNSNDPIISAMDQDNEEIATLIANNKNFVVNEEIVVNAIIHHFDVCLEALLNHNDFELDVNYQKEKPLYIASEKGTSQSIKIIFQKYKNKININEIKNTKVTPEKDAQIRNIIKDIYK